MAINFSVTKLIDFGIVFSREGLHARPLEAYARLERKTSYIHSTHRIIVSSVLIHYPSFTIQNLASNITFILKLRITFVRLRESIVMFRVKVMKVFSYSSKIFKLFHWLNMARICCNHFCTLRSVTTRHPLLV